MIPVRATYRVQFNAAFGFADGAALVPYLAALGISHLYASPVFAARTGSTHGYDITDYNRLNPALGTEAEFHAMAQALHDRGMGLILDVVPNHMGIGGADNPFWENVLEWGPDSPYAAWFDIDWHSPVLDGKLLFPFLGKPYATVLAEGGLALRLDDKGRLAIWAHDAHRLPICPRDYACVLAEAGSPLAGAFAAMGQAGPQDPGWSRLQSQLAAEGLTLEGFTDPERLDALIRRQHWRAAKFTLDADAINYRRFFTISDLAGVRVESPSVFAKTHAYVLSLIRDGWVDGLRIDHIDGLRDPKAYCLRLQDTVGRPFPLYVEKILGPQEALPADWQTDGTTGYEFANEVVTLLADPAGTETLTALYHEVAGHDTPPENVVHAAKIAVLNGPMRAEREAVLCGLLSLAGRVPEWADLGRGALREGLVQTIAALDIYRTYADATGLAPEDRARLAAALDRAAALAPELDPAVWEALSAILTLDLADRLPDHRTAITEAVMRFQQLTGPVMAKGLEDRALYRFNRLLALNEVGAHPGQFTLSVAAFHRVQLARQASLPQTMLGTSSHDTKRGEDARMRIVSLTSHARLWRQKTGAWLDMLQDNEAPVDRDVVYALLQILVGVWPDAEVDLPVLEGRVTGAMVKSLREAGVHSRWIGGDSAYEAQVARLVEGALRSEVFVASFTRMLGRIRPQATADSLIQTALKLTVPGVPDIYQGAELWDQSLVDPDNRRPVDFALRAGLLDSLVPGPIHARGRPAAQVKLALIATLLRLRANHPAVFAKGRYLPLQASGPAADGFLGFLRCHGSERLMVAAALHPASHGPAAWRQTQVALPEEGAGQWVNLMNGRVTDLHDPSALFREMPLAVLRPLRMT